jgi:stage IV sporulation protein FB
MGFQGGYLTLGRWGAAPVRVHWTLPLGAFFFGHLQWVPGFWLGFFLVILIHEMGHAFVVLRQRARVLAIEVHGIGGVCRWTGDVSAVGRARIAWGGVQAQFFALLAALGARQLFGPPPSAFTAELLEAFTTTNILIIGLNLIPVPPLDGAEAWKLFALLRQQRARRRAPDVRPAVERELAALDASDRAPRDQGWSFDDWMKKQKPKK